MSGTFTFSPEKNGHDGFHTAKVLFTNSTIQDAGFTFSASVQLENGDKMTVRAKALPIASQTVETACLERRREVSGDVFYRLKGQINCAGAVSGE